MKRKVKNVSILFDNDTPIDVESLEECVNLSIITKCPEKYLLVDKETGVVYNGSSEPNSYIKGHCLWKEVI
jgi:hypothetical protein